MTAAGADPPTGRSGRYTTVTRQRRSCPYDLRGRHLVLLFSPWRGERICTVVTIMGAAGIPLSSMLYFTSDATPRFLLDKGHWADQPWWLATFYCHVVAASLSLLIGIPLMVPAWTRRHPAWHRLFGYAYVNAVLWLAAPTGFLLALTATGGLLGTLGFGLASVLWWHATWSGYRAIRRTDLPTHIAAMARSFAFALSAPAFRLIQIALSLGSLPDDVVYLVSLWTSVAVSVVLGETCAAHVRHPSFIPCPVLPGEPS